MGNTGTTRTLLQLALTCAERGDANGAATLLNAALELPHDAPDPIPHAETFAAFGRRIGKSASTIRALAKRVGLATLGNGRGKRLIVAEALAKLDALRVSSAEEAGARRGALRANR